MKLLTDKYGRTWLVEYRTYTLLTAKQLAMLKKIIPILLFSICSFGQASKYTFYVKLNKLLTTTKVDTSLYKKTNIYNVKEFKNNSDAIAHGLKVGEFYSLPMVDGVSLIAIVKTKPIETKGSIENTVTYLSREK